MQDKIIEILVELLGVSAGQVVPHARLEEDLGADSLDMQEIFMAIEEEYQLEVEASEEDKLKTVENIHNYLYEKGIS